LVTSVLSASHFIVFDNFLSEQERDSVWSYIQSEEFQFVHQKKWVKAFRLSDNEPLWGPPYLSDSYAPDTQNQVYPSGKGIDLVIQKLKEIIPQYVSLLGEQGKDWAYFFARAYLYPCGTGLSWHRDNQNHACGAFVYYAHPYWNPQWGAELLISSPQTATLEFPKRTLYEGGKKYLGSHLDNKFETDALMEEGMGHYILAKPNRLVLMGSGVLHCIKRVDANAGDHVRATIQGFFQDPLGKIQRK
jgi:Rps23 Pro-64 3,4-dihydroxylase Tpa1-like proline 4-hydroxylase